MGGAGGGRGARTRRGEGVSTQATGVWTNERRSPARRTLAAVSEGTSRVHSTPPRHGCVTGSAAAYVLPASNAHSRQRRWWLVARPDVEPPVRDPEPHPRVPPPPAKQRAALMAHPSAGRVWSAQSIRWGLAPARGPARGGAVGAHAPVFTVAHARVNKKVYVRRDAAQSREATS